MRLRSLTAVGILVLLSACSNPVPPGKQDYIGKWQGDAMTLSILADGSITYKRYKQGGAVTINGPLQGFEGDDFMVGIGFLNTTFEVTEPPTQVDGSWQMVVDGVTLTRSDHRR